MSGTAAGTLLANKQVEQCVRQHNVRTLCNMNDMPSQALAQLVGTRASTFTAFRNGYGLRAYSLKMRYGLSEYILNRSQHCFRESKLDLREILVLPIPLLNRSYYC